MTDTTTSAAAEVAPSKWRTGLIWLAKKADKFGAWFRDTVWNSGLLKRSITVPAKLIFVGAFLLIGASLFVKAVHKISPTVAETVGIEEPAQCAPANTAPLKSVAPEKKPAPKAAKKKVAKPRNDANFGFFN